MENTFFFLSYEGNKFELKLDDCGVIYTGSSVQERCACLIVRLINLFLEIAIHAMLIIVLHAAL